MVCTWMVRRNKKERTQGFLHQGASNAALAAVNHACLSQAPPQRTPLDSPTSRMSPQRSVTPSARTRTRSSFSHAGAPPHAYNPSSVAATPMLGQARPPRSFNSPTPHGGSPMSYGPSPSRYSAASAPELQDSPTQSRTTSPTVHGVHRNRTFCRPHARRSVDSPAFPGSSTPSKTHRTTSPTVHDVHRIRTFRSPHARRSVASPTQSSVFGSERRGSPTNALQVFCPNPCADVSLSLPTYASASFLPPSLRPALQSAFEFSNAHAVCSPLFLLRRLRRLCSLLPGGVLGFLRRRVGLPLSCSLVCTCDAHPSNRE